MKIVTVVGARPQFVKAAMVSRAFRQTREDVLERLVHTGQHYDANMSDVFFEELEIPAPDYHLGIGGGTHGQNTGRMIEGIEQVLFKERPAWVLVYGDTDSTLAAALAAAKLHIRVAHVEAGLRSFNRRMPEEINRVLTDQVSELLFAPTDAALRNLKMEGISPRRVHNVGDVMYDAALYYASKADVQSPLLHSIGVESKRYVLATVHREENTDNIERLRSILLGFAKSSHPVVWPIHPRARKRIAESGLAIPAAVRALNPVGPLAMALLEKHAHVIATDSGGVQKEAYFYQVPCITLRDETEWTELVECGANELTGARTEAIASALNRTKPFPTNVSQYYGNGNASMLIAKCFS